MPDEPTNIYDRKFLLFSGKGGVGKTTIASAFALSCARRGERTLLMELNTRDKVSSMFGSDRVGTKIVEVEDNLFAVNITPEAAQEEYALMMLKLRVVYRAIFENRIIKAFLRVIPGLNELVMLGKAYYHVIEEDENGRPVWDKVVIDAPATGHGIFLFQIPDVISSILSSGHMFEEAQRINAVLRDPQITAMNLVTLPEEMPVNETRMLYDSVIGELKIPPGLVITNGVYPELFDARENEVVSKARSNVETGSLVANLLDAAQFRSMRVKMQRGYRDEIKETVAMPNIEIPFFFAEKLDFKVLNAMADAIEAPVDGGHDG